MPAAAFDRRWFAAAVLTALVALVYWPTAGFQFLNWDDPWYVVDNPLVKSWSPSNLVAVATEPCSKNFAPVTIFTLLVEHTAFGLWAGGYHIVNGLLHALNAVLVFILVRQVTKSSLAAWLSAILFAVHPIQIETVAWVSSLKSLLAATGMLVSLLYWLKAERSGRDVAMGLAWLVFALLAKASAVVVPAIVLLYDILVQRKKFSEALARQILPGLFCLMALFLNMHAQNQIWGGSREHFHWGRVKILAVDSVIVWRYLRMLAAPFDLSVMYDVDGSNPWPAAAVATAAWALVTWLAWRVRHTRPIVAWAYATWWLLLFPVLNIFPITTLMNDRYLYLPCVLAFAGVGVSLEALLRRLVTATQSPGFGPRMAVTATAGVLVAAVMSYAAMSMRYVQVWRNPTTLWAHALERSPNLPVVQIQWALTLHGRGETERACQVLEDVLSETRADEGDRLRIARILSEWRPAGSAT
jgi:protein O-mannosyl-transferase